MVELFFPGLLTVPVVVLGIVVVGTSRGRVRPHTLLAAGAITLGLLMALAGIFHTIAVAASALKGGKPYDFRFVSLIATGLILVYSGVLNIAISRWLRQGKAWAIAMSAAATFFLCIYFVLLLPISSQGLGVLLNGCYLCFLALHWNTSRERSGTLSPRSAARRAISQTGVALALVAIISQLVLAFGSQFRLDFGAREAGVAIMFLAGPVYGALLVCLFSPVAWFYGRSLARRLEGEHLDVYIWLMAATVVLVATLFRETLGLYLRAVSGGGIDWAPPDLADVIVYGVMIGPLIAGVYYNRRNVSTNTGRAAAHSQ